MNSEEKIPDANAIIPEDKQSLAARSPALISRGLRDLTSSLDSILVEMGKALALSKQFGDEIETIGYMFEKANEVFRSETYSLFVLAPGKDELSPFVLVPEKDELWWSPPFGNRKDFLPIHIKIGEGVAEVGYLDTPIKRTGAGLAGLVARTGQVVVVPDTSKDSRFVVEVDGKGTPEAHSIVAAPVRVNQRCLGVIELINCVGPEGFSRRKLLLLEALADFAAVSIDTFRHLGSYYRSTVTDEITGLNNARNLNQQIDYEIERSERHGYDLSLALIHLGGLAEVSEYRRSMLPGQLRDSERVSLNALSEFGQLLKSECRLIDSVFYCGGGTFAVLFPTTSKESSCLSARRLYKRFGETMRRQYADLGVGLGANVGLASYPVDARTKTELLQRADEALSLVENSAGDGVAAVKIGVLSAL
jgi:GGDEF domain-containing protein